MGAATATETATDQVLPDNQPNHYAIKGEEYLGQVCCFCGAYNKMDLHQRPQPVSCPQHWLAELEDMSRRQYSQGVAVRVKTRVSATIYQSGLSALGC